MSVRVYVFASVLTAIRAVRHRELEPDLVPVDLNTCELDSVSAATESATSDYQEDFRLSQVGQAGHDTAGTRRQRDRHGLLEGVGGLKTSEAYHSKAKVLVIPEM